MFAHIIKPVRQVVSSARRKLHSGAFNHVKAQIFESRFADKIIKTDFTGLYNHRAQDRANGGVWLDEIEWFNNDKKLLHEFIDHTTPRQNLEIGCGPFGVVPLCDWMQKRAVIDPLADRYRSLQLQVAGKTFFGDDVQRFSISAETMVESLCGKVDGSIICRNALDHAEDPLSILNNIADYAAPGCYLLFFSDIWHLDGHDDGHRNITRSTVVMDRLLDGLGFDILWYRRPVRDPEDYIEYGCVARKR